MKNLILAIYAAFLLSPFAVDGQIPQLMNYQGRIQVGANNFDGIGQFKFALVSASGPNARTFWRNDGLTDHGEPATAVSLAVSKGLYAILLGDTNKPNMAALPASAFNRGEVYLRIWFSDGMNGFQKLTPDQRIAAVGYAMVAETAKVAESVQGLRVEPSAGGNAVNVAGGWAGNVIAPGIAGATIAGGGTANYASRERPNKVSADYGTVGGGFGNASSLGATVAGGAGNEATGSLASIGGGDGNRASGLYSTVPGGIANLAGGNYSFAAGRRGKANHAGAFVWADSADEDFATTASDQFLIRARGGVGIGTASPTSALEVNGAVTATHFLGGASGLSDIPGATAWRVVAGREQVAVGNIGYIVTNESDRVNISLPPSPRIGDLFQVTSASPTGWQISRAPGTAQMIFAPALEKWEGDSTFPSQLPRSDRSRIAGASGDGKTLVVAGMTNLFISPDGGTTWVDRVPPDLATSTLQFWNPSLSADGKTILVSIGRRLLWSGDYGETWQRFDSGGSGFNDVAISADGNFMAAAEGSILLTKRGAGPWTSRPAPNGRLIKLAPSFDGRRILGVTSGLVTSEDWGETWVTRYAHPESWRAIASSYDGRRLVAAGERNLYLSSDFGATWTMHGGDGFPGRGPEDSWHSVFCSADGMKILAAAEEFVHLSTDFGKSWSKIDMGPAGTLAASADASLIIITPQTSGTARIWRRNPTPGLDGYMVGGAYATIELQYVGGERFVALRHSGTITTP